MTAYHTIWWCEDEECNCHQLRIYAKDRKTLLAEGPYGSEGEFDDEGSMAVIAQFIETHMDWSHEFDLSVVHLMKRVIEKSWRYGDLQ